MSPTTSEVERDERNWKPALAEIVRDHNWKHAKKPKGVSYRTQELRLDVLYRIFTLLRQARYRFAPYRIGGRHIAFLMRYWTAAPGVVDELRERGSKLQPLDEPHSPAYIQSLLSTLRVFCEWIGKPGLVMPAAAYAAPHLVKRHGNATHDRTWSGANVDRAAVFARVTCADVVVGLQLEVITALGLRRKEGVMFCPANALVPSYALPPGATSTDYVSFLEIKRGTKGGRLRYTALRNDWQREVYARALRAAPHPGAHIGRPGLSLKQSLDHFSNVLRKCGVTRKDLGITPHGLRHEFASDLFFELTEALPPVKGGQPHLDREVMEAAYLEVARQLGHGRPRVTGAYLGSVRSKAASNVEDGDE